MGKHLKKYRIALETGIFLVIFFCCSGPGSMQAEAYFGKNEDYLLVRQKPTDRGRDYYLEFVNEDGKIHTVQEGDTLWEIAREYYGSGLAYEKLLEENKELVDMPENLQIGTNLKISERLYTRAGMKDFMDENVVLHRVINGPDAWKWERGSQAYEIFQSITYRNDLGEHAPYQNWEDFQKEVINCSRRLCGDRVSDLSFARYQVTGLCDMCYYQFAFDGGGEKYVIMASLACTDTTKSEAFAVCDMDKCSQTDLEEIKGKLFYTVVRHIYGGMWYAKDADYVGAEDWKYPQLHNPFTQAMRTLCDEPLARIEDYPDNYEIVWKEPVLEDMVREELVELWQLTEEECTEFMERPVTAGDLAAVESLQLYVDQKEEEVLLQLNRYQYSTKRSEDMLTGLDIFYDRETSTVRTRTILTTLDDLGNFPSLKRVDIKLYNSSITDFSALGRMEGLRELCVDHEDPVARLENEDMGFLKNLKNLRQLCLYGRQREGLGSLYVTQAYEGVTDMSVLKNCSHLAYLRLSMGNVECYDFLEELPEIHYIDLEGREENKNVIPDESLLPNACFIEFYGDQVRFDVG